MRNRFLKRLAGGIAVAVMTAVLLGATATTADARRRVVHRSYVSPHRIHHVHYVGRTSCRGGHVVHAPVRTVRRYHTHRGYGCRYHNGYYHHPRYGAHYHGSVGFGVHVVF